MLFQEEQGTNPGAQQTSSRLERSLLPDEVLPAILQPVYGLLVEAALVLLEEPAIHCCSVSLHYLHCPDVWHHVLGPRIPKVSSHYNHDCCYHLNSDFFLVIFRLRFRYCQIAGVGSRICTMLWDQCMLQFSSSGSRMQGPCSQW